jgi:hypothetical protein
LPLQNALEEKVRGSSPQAFSDALGEGSEEMGHGVKEIQMRLITKLSRTCSPWIFISILHNFLQSIQLDTK